MKQLTKEEHDILEDILENGEYEDLTDFLVTTYGDYEIFTYHPELVESLANTLESFYHEELCECKSDLINYLSLKLDTYQKKKKKHNANWSRHLFEIKGTHYWTKEDRQNCNYDFACLDAVLRHLDEQYWYHQYNTGYYYQQSKIWKWLYDQLQTV